MDRNWVERAYLEECTRERARIAIREEIEKSKPKKKRGLAQYISYAAIGVVAVAFLHYFGNIFGINLSSMLDTNFLLPIIVLLGFFIASMKGWI